MTDFFRRVIRGPDLALDVGTATTRLAVANREGELVRPSLLGGTHPLRSGVVVDRGAASSLLKLLVDRARYFHLSRPRVLVCAPSDASPEEREALIESVRGAGVSSVAVIPEPLAAAIGAGMDLSLPYGQLIVDIGEGVTDCAVIQSGELVATAAVRAACSDLHEAVQQVALRECGLVLSRTEAERITLGVGIGTARDPASAVVAEGIGAIDGRLGAASVPIPAIEEAQNLVVDRILETILAFLKDLPASLGAQVIDNPARLTGGGALLRGMVDLISANTGLCVTVPDDPLGAVIRGSRRVLPNVPLAGLWVN
ncbi:MAG: rod shape-determining protein [Phycisphaerae bacterium]|nr:rod shape-determining protein [Phycisphaerae bacterium]